jgi:copper chaperone
MKSFIKPLMYVLLIVVGSILLPEEGAAQNRVNVTENTKQNLKTIELEVGGMTCQKGCADGIDGKLKTISGVSKSKTKLESGISKITYDDTKVTLEKLISTIEERGYTAKVSAKGKKI